METVVEPLGDGSFAISGGVRNQTPSGIRTSEVAHDLETGDHDGRDVMAVDLQLAECEKTAMLALAE